MLQLEIEDMIHNGLKYYLEPRDYILRINLVGEQHVSVVKSEVLPGFGPMAGPGQETVEKYWKIFRMKVNLCYAQEGFTFAEHLHFRDRSYPQRT